jgi:hypothetical protein
MWLHKFNLLQAVVVVVVVVVVVIVVVIVVVVGMCQAMPGLVKLKARRL